MTSDEDYWRRAGEAEPYWAVLSQPKYETAAIDDAGKAAFYAEGEQDIAFARSSIVSHFGQFTANHALDFGCGVGRLTAPMARHAGYVTGVDVAPGMRKLANEHFARMGIANAIATDRIPDHDLDWINSYIVFQHIRPALGVEILRALLSRLKPDGVTSLHFSIYRDHNTMHRAFSEVSHGRFDGQNFVGFSRAESDDMPVYEYDLGELFSVFHSHGIEQIFTHHTNHGGTHGVWVFGRRR